MCAGLIRICRVFAPASDLDPKLVSRAMTVAQEFQRWITSTNRLDPEHYTVGAAATFHTPRSELFTASYTTATASISTLSPGAANPAT